MATENPIWDEERIANELPLKLGLRVSPRTGCKYMPKRPLASVRFGRRSVAMRDFVALPELNLRLGRPRHLGLGIGSVGQDGSVGVGKICRASSVYSHRTGLSVVLAVRGSVCVTA
jgi:hypothetical protein